MIYTTIDNRSQLQDAFHAMGRGDSFSFDALESLFEYLSDFEEDIELDVIAICCEFSEMDAEEILRNFDLKLEDLILDDDGVIEILRDYLGREGYIVLDGQPGHLVIGA